jgi:hypothetical protein
LIDPAIAIHNGRLVKRLGDGAIVEFRSVVEAVRCAMEVNRGLAERNTNLRDDQRIDVRVGIHLGDVVEEADGDLMGDGVNIAARLETICEPGKIFLSEDAYRQVRDKIHGSFADLGERSLKNVAWPMRVYALPAPAGGRREIGPATVAAKVSASPRRKELRAGVATAVSAILEGLTATKKAGNERLANPERDAVGFSRVFPLVDWAARRRRRIRLLIAFAVLLVLAVRYWRSHEQPVLAPSPAPPPASSLDALERLQQLRPYSPPSLAPSQPGR